MNKQNHMPYGMFTNIFDGINLIDANTPWLSFGINEKELKYLEQITMAWLQDCKARTGVSLEEVARQIISDETEIDLGKYDMKLSANGARGAIVEVVKSAISKEKPFVAYASPNWIFDKIIGEIKGAQICTFHGTNAGEFVDGFEGFAMEELAALIIVDPANPVGYRLEEAHIRHIEDLAEQYGITVIYDDVFRGLQAHGGRISISEKSRNSVIVETTSKRFGPRGLGATWTLIPKGMRITPNITIGCEGCESIVGLITKALYETGYGERMRKMIMENSEALYAGMRDIFSGEPIGDLHQAFDGMPVITYYLPQNVLSHDLAMRLSQSQVLVKSGVDFICEFEKIPEGDLNNERILHGLSYIRMCPTKVSADQAYLGGVMIASFVKNAMRASGR
jgi:aspartate/methionine/tyrosine aminotransferase